MIENAIRKTSKKTTIGKNDYDRFEAVSPISASAMITHNTPVSTDAQNVARPLLRSLWDI